MSVKIIFPFSLSWLLLFLIFLFLLAISFVWSLNFFFHRIKISTTSTRSKMIFKRDNTNIEAVTASLNRDDGSTTYMNSESVVSAMSDLSSRVQSLETLNKSQKTSIAACIAVIIVFVVLFLLISTIVALRYVNRVRAAQGDEEIAGSRWAMFSLGPTLNNHNNYNQKGSLQRTLSDNLTPIKPITMLDSPFSTNQSTDSQDTLTTPYNFSKESPASSSNMYYNNQNGYMHSADTFHTQQSNYAPIEEHATPSSSSGTTVSRLPPTIDFDYNASSSDMHNIAALTDSYDSSNSNDVISFKGDQMQQNIHQQHPLEPIREIQMNPGGLEIRNITTDDAESVMDANNKMADNRFTIDVEFDPFTSVSPKKIETFQESQNYHSPSHDANSSSEEVSPHTIASTMDFPNTQSIANGFEYMREYLEGEGGITPKDLESSEAEDYSNWLPPAEPAQKYEPETRATSFYADTF